MSVVTYAELRFGVHISSRKKKNLDALELLTAHLAVLDWPRDAASHYAEIRADLKRGGAMIGANDLLIAAHARSLGAVVVTNNTKEFARVRGLRVENWMA